jgi:hypothetical protein
MQHEIPELNKNNILIYSTTLKIMPTFCTKISFVTPWLSSVVQVLVFELSLESLYLLSVI